MKQLTIKSFKERIGKRAFVVFEYSDAAKTFLVPYTITHVKDYYIAIDESIIWKFEECSSNYLQYIPKKHEIASRGVSDVRRILLFKTEVEANTYMESNKFASWLKSVAIQRAITSNSLSELQQIQNILVPKTLQLTVNCA